jgi:hypothetical protein
MSTLSQPQTPAALDSPLREHRHRPVERLTDRLEAPLTDQRSYRVVRLPNQLEVLLVHDADTDKASAAMDVNVGNFSDEADMSGMVSLHFSARNCPFQCDIGVKTMSCSSHCSVQRSPSFAMQ